MNKPRKEIAIQIDGETVGAVSLPWNCSERQKVLAATRLPGVLERLRRDGVAAAYWTATTYNILTKPISTRDLPVMEGEPAPRPSKTKRVPFRGLGIPTAFGDRPLM